MKTTESKGKNDENGELKGLKVAPEFHQDVKEVAVKLRRSMQDLAESAWTFYRDNGFGTRPIRLKAGDETLEVCPKYAQLIKDLTVGLCECGSDPERRVSDLIRIIEFSSDGIKDYVEGKRSTLPNHLDRTG